MELKPVDPFGASLLQDAQPGFRQFGPGQTHSEEYYLNMGPQHPSTHGVLRLVVRLDGETVLEVVPHLGYIHRAIEKMGENETFVQYIHLTDRMDYLSSHHNNLSVCMAIEKAMNIGVPERGEYIRVIVSELQRIQSHLLWWGVLGMDLGAITAFLYGFKEREKITSIFEELCGARLTMNYFRPGGSMDDVPDTFIPRVKQVIEDMKKNLVEYDTLLSKNIIAQERMKGIGILTGEKAISYGCSGPTLRASGVNWDLRKHDPYSIYERFDFAVPVGIVGDCWDRYDVRMREMAASVYILEQAVASFPEGPYRAKEKPAYKVPAGSYFAQVEASRGIFGTYFVSEGAFKPHRIHSRSPNLANLSAVNDMAVGYKLADLVTITSTIDLVIPDMDR